MEFLRISNPGVAPIECFTVFGLSLTRDSADRTGLSIGQFGSGSKFSIPLLLRFGIHTVMCLGEKVVTPFGKKICIDDGISSTEATRLYYSVKEGENASEIETSSVLDFGRFDWTSVKMACREFVSNAIDRCLREFGNYEDVKISIVSVKNPEQIKGREGFTDIYIEATPDIISFYENIDTHFLHFRSSSVLAQKVLTKAPGSNPFPSFYRNGVLVRTIEQAGNSLFNYNFGSEFILDESRNSSDYNCINLAGTSIATNLSDSQIRLLVKAIFENDNTLFEVAHIPLYTIKYNLTIEARERWGKVVNKALGSRVLTIIDPIIVTKLLAKKIEHVAIASSWFDVLSQLDIKTHISVLDSLETKGIDTIDPSEETVNAFNNIYLWLNNNQLIKTNKTDSSLPSIKEFVNNANAGEQTHGFYDRDRHLIGIKKGESGEKLLQTMLEEICHWITGSGDTSIDFQEFAFKVAVTAIKEQI